LREVDVVVIGAGVIGLAAAAELARRGRSVVILERDAGNSEVVHAGLYYPADSLKAGLCVSGRVQLEAWCRDRGVRMKRTGKLIVATRDSEFAVLEDLLSRGEANGVTGLSLLDAQEVEAREPMVRARAALWSSETGIVDGQGLCLSLLADAESHGAVLLLHHDVLALGRVGGDWGVEVRVADESATQRVRCGAVVNAAGLASESIARLAGVDVDAAGYRLHFCKGDYFALAPGAPVALRHLVYPVPDPAGLGVHATLDLDGRIRFGPDAEFVSSPDFRIDDRKAARFAEVVRRYLPMLEDEWLRADYAGVRPRLAGPGEGFRDFVVSEESSRGLPGLVDCIGIESPGLTAALAIGKRVASLLA
jgi:L-2-hydroxyglutarate oxidase LhgO